ncbi:unnamed protein product [marine sediment metagenome]|uniref:Uncharacterized protein n=1 Tax=marine sediment metagenome TaxID=412755 RepID=X0YGL6_9ZZZZ
MYQIYGVSGKNLREDFILRELEATGSAQYTYTFYTAKSGVTQTDYYLPISFPYPATDDLTDDDDQVNFPALPVVNREEVPGIVIVTILVSVPETV